MSDRDSSLGTGEHAARREPDTLQVLLSDIASGDRDAFEELYRLTAPKLFGVCRRILQSRSDAEEALQDCYLSLWRRADRFDPSRGSPLAWLVALARNRAIDRFRATSTQSRTALAAGLATTTELSPTADAGLETRALRDCLETLDRYDADMICTAFFAGHTYSELAQAAGLPLGTVKSRVRRALQRLRECLS